MLVLACVVLGAVWHGQSQHEATLAALNDLKRVISAHQNQERNQIYSAEFVLEGESKNLDVVTSADDLDQNQTIPFAAGLRFLTSSFVHTDELLNILVKPLETRNITLQQRCEQLSTHHNSKIATMQQMLRFIANLTAQLEAVKHQVDVSQEQQLSSQRLLHLKAQQMIQMAAAITGQQLNTTVPIASQLDFIDQLKKVIASFDRLIRDELRSERQQLVAVIERCHNDTGLLGETFANAHQQLQAAEQQLNRVIRSFAYVAKQDVGQRIDQLGDVSKGNAEIRKKLYDLIDQAADQSEQITLSQCDDNCSAHGSCWSGVCHCDDGWGGLNCGLAVAT